VLLSEKFKLNVLCIKNTQVKACSLPQLPRYKELVSDLAPIHSRLSSENALAKKHAIYKCNEVQVPILLIVWIYCFYNQSFFLEKKVILALDHLNFS